MNNIDDKLNELAPREGEEAGKPGSYEQIFRMVTPIIDPGDLLEIEQYFSGYGKIKNAKLCFYTSNNIFDPEISKVIHSLNQSENGALTFGASEDAFTHTGMFFDLSSGLGRSKWSEMTYFFDVGKNAAPQISTEMKIGEAPFKYNLYTKKSITPGIYYLEFCFTYFDGYRWRNSSRTIDFKVRNFLERNDVLIGFLAVLASLVAIFGLAILPLIKWIYSLL